jgi:uncharacterized protein YeaO (DUF488 family)
MSRALSRPPSRPPLVGRDARPGLYPLYRHSAHRGAAHSSHLSYSTYPVSLPLLCRHRCTIRHSAPAPKAFGACQRIPSFLHSHHGEESYFSRYQSCAPDFYPEPLGARPRTSADRRSPETLLARGYARHLLRRQSRAIEGTTRGLRGFPKMKLKLHTFQVGSPRKRGEGIRVGTVRFLPRGIRKKDYARLDYFDVWFPALAPSRSLIAWARDRDFDESWQTFAKRYEREMIAQTNSRQALLLLAQLAQKVSLSIGCYCGDESRCHRSILQKLIERAARNKL